ncbi:large ribosomal subunit protein mL37 [Bacillus rossius redtenbacheri]|uniref:large ribosomal subunit protein mL37 n=1 Tax=Bacillus rossius redtenbacheri TaxID=93214 RepID=UPI002FDE0CC5
MKVTAVLCNHHIGRMIRHLWKVKSKIEPIDRGTEAALAPFGIPITDPKDFLASRLNKVEKVHVEVVGATERPRARDRDHPLHHEQECHLYSSGDVLLKGLDQAKVLTNTVEVREGLPDALTRASGGAAHRVELIERCIRSSNIFEARYEKLPRYIDPARPYHHHARIWGITDIRKTELLTSRLVQLCGAVSGASRRVVRDGPVRVTLGKDGELLQLSVRADALLVSGRPLPALAGATDADGSPLPALGPVHPLISLRTDNFYDQRDVYPGGDRLFPRMLVLHGNATQVRNLHETPVTETQWLGRSLLNTFAVAAAHARLRYGADVRDLPEPVVLPCCHTDSRLFHFCVLQLNTLDLDSSSSRRNIFWSVPRRALFETCGYDSARPALRGLDPGVFDMFLAFYSYGGENHVAAESDDNR